MTELATPRADQDRRIRTRSARGPPRSSPAGCTATSSARRCPPSYPQFYDRGRGARVWDVDGREYVDFMCSFGPMMLGYAHAGVEQAAAAQRERGDTSAGPGAGHGRAGRAAHRAGSTTPTGPCSPRTAPTPPRLCLTVGPRRHRAGRKVVMARGAYHGWAAVVQPPARRHAGRRTGRPVSRTPTTTWPASQRGGRRGRRRATSPRCSSRRSATTPATTRNWSTRRSPGACGRCATGSGPRWSWTRCAAGFRLHHGGSWEPLGVRPDLSAWSKAIANGYPIGAALGGDAFREAAEQIFATGSFWYQAVPMAAAVATIRALRDDDAIASMEAAGTRLREGIASAGRRAPRRRRAARPGRCRCPTLSFAGDANFDKAMAFCGDAAAHGALPAPAAQLVLVGGAYRRRHRPGPRGDRRGVPRCARAVLVH